MFVVRARSNEWQTLERFATDMMSVCVRRCTVDMLLSSFDLTILKTKLLAYRCISHQQATTVAAFNTSKRFSNMEKWTADKFGEFAHYFHALSIPYFEYVCISHLFWVAKRNVSILFHENDVAVGGCLV